MTNEKACLVNLSSLDLNSFSLLLGYDGIQKCWTVQKLAEKSQVYIPKQYDNNIGSKLFLCVLFMVNKCFALSIRDFNELTLI